MIENYSKCFEVKMSIGMTAEEAKKLRKFLPDDLTSGLGIDTRFFESAPDSYRHALKRLDEVIKRRLDGNTYVEIDFVIGECFLIWMELMREGDKRNRHLRSIEEVFECSFNVWKPFDRAFSMIYENCSKPQRKRMLDLLKSSIEKLESEK